MPTGDGLWHSLASGRAAPGLREAKQLRLQRRFGRGSTGRSDPEPGHAPSPASRPGCLCWGCSKVSSCAPQALWWPGVVQVAARAMRSVACERNYLFFSRPRTAMQLFLFSPQRFSSQSSIDVLQKFLSCGKPAVKQAEGVSKQGSTLPKAQALSVKPSCPPQVEKGLVLWSESALCHISPRGKGRARTVSQRSPRGFGQILFVIGLLLPGL